MSESASQELEVDAVELVILAEAPGATVEIIGERAKQPGAEASPPGDVIEDLAPAHTGPDLDVFVAQTDPSIGIPTGRIVIFPPARTVAAKAAVQPLNLSGPVGKVFDEEALVSRTSLAEAA